MSFLEKELDEFGIRYIESCHEIFLELASDKQTCPRLSSPFHGLSSPQPVSPTRLRNETDAFFATAGPYEPGTCEEAGEATGPAPLASSFSKATAWGSESNYTNNTFGDLHGSSISPAGHGASSEERPVSESPEKPRSRPVKDSALETKKRGPIRRKNSERPSVGNPYYKRSPVFSSSSSLENRLHT